MKEYNEKGELTLRGQFIQVDFPLYDWRRSGQYAPDLTEYYDKPGLPHWSTWSFVINKSITVIVEDSNQDGIVDKCYTTKTQWPI